MVKKNFAAICLALFLGALCLSSPSLRAEDANAELDRRLAIKCAELQIQQLEARAKFANGSVERTAIDETLAVCQKSLENLRMDVKESLAKKLASIEAQMQQAKMGGKDNFDPNRMQFLDQARTLLVKKQMEAELGITLTTDDTQNRKLNIPPNSKLHVKLANGGELDAEGQWLQFAPEARDILDQFNDPAKDGALTIRVPDQIDVDALKEQIKKIAPKVTVEYAEKLRMLSAVSEDTAQLRRVTGIFKMLRGNPFDPNQKGRGPDFNPGMKPPMPPDMEMKKKKDGVEDKF